mmetsp:Transcript_6197/g.6365  ORF Transcript_6197/g.6365 Transcript_6197/m.6365 type:complete len:268 (+) Transcript_6197:128-931(+)|eukprot:CAMPEP_0119038048 /NCGR_PEP_ID=MMETSP1177-20130426/6720_1 /TAXON_ID=2985 /ORGANISM="Ochromonas sp, Strain CCMP1899" /LENGTH=267 /DNA_ID=CAMNT_0007000095 /DNA_START=108 /DNA_END=911 /DNA_ORIENTATION=-
MSMLVTKKTAATLGMSIHDANGSKVSDFAKRQMEKMGWQEGKGLGKNESGISKHIKAVKRDDNSGLGSEAVQAEEVKDNWWHDAFSKQLKVFQSSSGGKKKKKKSKCSDQIIDDAPPTYAELFAATGGARLGMRARAGQKGKFLRTEHEQFLIMEQEKISLAEKSVSSPIDIQPEKKIKKKDMDATLEPVEPEIIIKKKKRERETIRIPIEEPVSDIFEEVEKKKKKKNKKNINLPIEEVECYIPDEIEKKKKKKSKKTSKSADDEE